MSSMKKKIEIDYSISVEDTINRVKVLKRDNRFDDAIQELLTIEKQTRLAQQGESVTKILIEIVRLCGDLGRWRELNEYVILCSKKRSQIKQAITKMVQEGMSYIKLAPNKPTLIALLQTLREVTEGKIYVEVERADLVRKLAKIREDEGDIVKASALMQGVQVETIGSMGEKEKIDFILETMRLTLLKKDFIRMYIISKKITKRAISKEGIEDLRVRYYHLMIKYWIERKDFREITKCYYNIFNTRGLENPYEILQYLCLYIILAPHEKEQYELMNRIFQEKLLQESKMKRFWLLVKLFCGSELISWRGRMIELYETFLKNHPVYNMDQSRIKVLQSRVVEHNCRVVAKYYSRIHTGRLTQLLGTNHDDETEIVVSKLVNEGVFEAKIDRLDNVVDFHRNEDVGDTLNTWSASVHHILNIITKTNHLITKEKMLKKKEVEEMEDED